MFLVIHGRVQGVSFRYYARQQAMQLQLAGWIRNASNGTVEAEVEGDREAVRQFVEWAHEGPGMARVERVEVTPREPQGERAFHVVG